MARAPAAPDAAEAAAAARSDDDANASRGVLIFYRYADLSGAAGDDVAAALTAACGALSLRGRVRVADDGVNAALGGATAALRALCALVAALPPLQPRGGERGIDFQLSECGGAASASLAEASRFTSFSLRRARELVTLGPRAPPALAALPAAAAHIPPADFHALLLAASAQPVGTTVLLDVRNIYETRIGRFAAPGVATLQPRTRAFADFPAWADAHAATSLGGAAQVLMYCTGGVRCERASAYVRGCLAAAGGAVTMPRLLQLEGGITRYLAAYPASEQRLFQGVNFVFDERGVEGAADVAVGECAACAAPTADYTPRARCPACRLLLLLCARCAQLPPPRCELCAGSDTSSTPSETLCIPRALPRQQRRPLRLLCLHGFRQSGAGLAGRLAALRQRLEGIAELCFAEAPHALPPPARARCADRPQSCAADVAAARPRRAWLLSEADAAWSAAAAAARTAGAPPPPPPPLPSAPRRAADDTGYLFAEQTAGWQASLAAIEAALVEHAPVDGLFGLSQGAAAAAAAVAELSEQAAAAGEPLPLRFVWLVGGFVAAPHAQLLRRRAAPLALPSLHVFGGDDEAGGGDAHVGPSHSAALAACFAAPTLLRHAGGHLLPCDRQHVRRYADFLAHFAPAPPQEQQQQQQQPLDSTRADAT